MYRESFSCLGSLLVALPRLYVPRRNTNHAETKYTVQVKERISPVIAAQAPASIGLDLSIRTSATRFTMTADAASTKSAIPMTKDNPPAQRKRMAPQTH